MHNALCVMKVLLSSFHLNGHTQGFSFTDLERFELAHTPYTLILLINLKFDFERGQVKFNFQV